MKVKSTITLRAYDIVSDAVERGVQRGMTRAYKHTNDPSSDYIADQVEQAVLGELCEVLDFEGGSQ